MDLSGAAISGVILVALVVTTVVDRSFLVFIAVACLAGVLWSCERQNRATKQRLVFIGAVRSPARYWRYCQTTKVRSFKPEAPIATPVLKAAFEDRVNSRADLEDYKDAGGKPKPYPVFIVAAQGGGLVAAYHAAMVLSHLQDICPRFAHHVFAASGVSGGSFGAAVFASAVDRLTTEQSRTPCRREAVKQFQQYSENVLRNDFLSPLVFMAVIPTIAQRALSLLPVGLAKWAGMKWGDEVGRDREYWLL